MSPIEKPTREWGQSRRSRHWGPWTYNDLNGKPWIDVVRSEFPNGKKQHLPYAYAPGFSKPNTKSGMPAGPRYPFDVQLFADADVIFLVEGEKCMEILHRKLEKNSEIVDKHLGGKRWLVTCTQGGCDAWRREYARFFANKDVVIVKDANRPGWKYARDAARDILDLVASLRIYYMPNIDYDEDLEQFFDPLGGAASPGGFSNPDHLEEFFVYMRGCVPIETVDRLESLIEREISVIRLSDVEPEAIDWVWPGRIVRGKINLLTGNPDVTKTALTLYICARITTGESWPLHKGEAPLGNVIILSAEDDPADTIRPRFAAAGGDAERVTILEAVKNKDGAEQTFNMSRDLDKLEHLVRRVGDVVAVVIDPLNAYIGTSKNVDGWKDQDIRSVLAPVAKLAAKYKFAVIVVCHNTKGSRETALARVMGSVGLGAAARSAYLVVKARDDLGNEIEDQRLLLPMKLNIGKPVKGLSYRVVDRPTGFPEVPMSFGIEWTGTVDKSANEAMAEAARKVDRRSSEMLEEAVKIITEMLDEQDPRPAKEIEERLRAEGIGPKSALNARKRLGVSASHPKVPGPWFWGRF